jgi:ABC-type dipeptide/oligopeptide/nickel transport system ATPase component
LLKIKDLQVHFFTDYGVVKAVDGIDLTLQEGEALGILGESGCGKSMTALAVMGLVPFPGRITGGEIIFAGRDLCRLTEKEMRRIRGKEIAMIFQDPLTTLNPVLKVGEQITEAIRLHHEEGGPLSCLRPSGLLPFLGRPAAKRDGCLEKGGGDDGKSGDPFPGVEDGRVPAPVQRGNAAAGDDCHCLIL